MSFRNLMLLMAPLITLIASPATNAALIGATATLSMNNYNVGGTITVIDEDTFRADNFTYNSGAPAVYFYLGTDETNAAFTAGIEILPALTGMNFDGTQGPLFYDLPAGETFAGINAISVWCAAFGVNFGSGMFDPIEGDLDGDGFVGIADLNLVLGDWNQNVPPANPLADPSGDNFVGIADLNFVLGSWNVGTPPPATNSVPEPATAATLGGLGFALLRRR
jgi:hypothetical protein